MSSSQPKRVKAIAADLERQGARVRETKRGYMVHFKDGSSLTMTLTESDPRAEQNTRSRVKRAGLSWLFDAE